MKSSFRPASLLPSAEFVPMGSRPSAAPPGTPMAAAVTPPADLEERIRRAFEEGAASGRAELPWQEAEALQSATAAIGELRTQLEARCQLPVVDVQNAVVELAVAIAHRVVGDRLAAGIDALVPLLTETLAQLSGNTPLSIHLAAEDHATLLAGDGGALRELAEQSGAELLPDAELARGTVRVRGGESTARVALPAALEQLHGFLRDAAASPPSEGGPT